MHDAETRALKRAIILLLLVSMARWGWSTRAPALDPGDVDVLPALLDASRDAAEEASRRSAPLGEGERIDPNRADAVELDRLPGVGPSVASAIEAARDAGTVFTTPEDLLQVRGIGPATLGRMRGSLDLTRPPTTPRGEGASAGHPSAQAETPVDLNRADLAELQRLPGIGPAIAERILVARREQVFTSVDDLIRVRGVGPVTVERIRPLAIAGSTPR